MKTRIYASDKPIKHQNRDIELRLETRGNVVDVVMYEGGKPTMFQYLIRFLVDGDDGISFYRYTNPYSAVVNQDDMSRVREVRD